jgi:hypothetical protein
MGTYLSSKYIDTNGYISMASASNDEYWLDFGICWGYGLNGCGYQPSGYGYGPCYCGYVLGGYGY